jgi:hypothetical protein
MKRNATIMFCFVLLIICSFNFYIVFPTGSNINWNGVIAAKISATVGIFALLFLSYRKIESILIKKGFIQDRIKTAYDYVPLILIILFATGGRYVGDKLNDSITPKSGVEFKWIFSWGLTNENSFIVIILALVILLLYRFYRLIDAIDNNN